MFISRFYSLAALALGLSLIFAPPTVLVSAQVECAASTDAAYMYQVSPQDGFVIFWSVDATAETVSFKVDYTGLAWAAVGFSVDGMMVGSDAVIGLPDDGTVLEYSLDDQSPYAVLVYTTQEIEDASVSQDATTTSVMFTRLLTPADATKEVISSTPGDETILIWAFGTSNYVDGHEPTSRGSVTLDVFCGSDGAVTGSTPAPSASGAPTAMEPVSTLLPLTASPIFVGTQQPTGGGPPEMETAAPTATGGGSGPPTMNTSAPTASDGGRGPPTIVPTAAPTATMDPAAAETSAPSPTSRGVPGGETSAPSSSAPTIGPTPTAGGSETSSPAGGDDQQTGGGLRVMGGGGGAWVAGVASGVAVLLASGVMFAW